MSLTLALNTALSGLNVNQRSLSVLSQNIANANNPEYSRQVLTQQAMYLQGVGAGVSITDIGRKVDDYLASSVVSQNSVYSAAQTTSTYSDRLQVLLGQPGSNNSIDAYMSNFFNALQTLAQAPEDASLQVGAVNIANSTAKEIQSLAYGIYGMQYQADKDISSTIEGVNTSLKQIYNLNAVISSNTLLGRPVSELQDQRDTLLKQVASAMDVQTYPRPDGTVNLFTANGKSLIDENLYQLSFTPAPSADAFASGVPSSSILINRVDENGNVIGQPAELASGGVGSSVTTILKNGTIKGLLEMRDRQLPDVLAKVDMLAGTLRDAFNAVQNAGNGYPGANSYTGTRLVSSEDYNQWSGQTRIAVLDSKGQPIPSNYANDSTGMPPLLIDLGSLDTGTGKGQPTTQGIIDEINRYYGVPQNKVELGDVNNISLAINNTMIPGTTPQLNFDFQLQNLSANKADFFVTGIQVLDSNNTDITNITQDVPSIGLAITNTYTTTEGSTTVAVRTAIPNNYKEGDRIYLSPPSADVNGIPSNALGGFFTVSNVTPTGFNIDVSVIPSAVTAGSANASNVISRPVYASVNAGDNTRTTNSGTIIANVATNPISPYYTVNASVAVANKDGTVSTSTITYRIDNFQNGNVINTRYAAQAATNDGQIVRPNTIQPALRAIMVDDKGNELPIVNNQYSTTQKGYLKLVASDPNNVVAIDSMDSQEGGRPNAVPSTAGTGRSISHYFEMNNFFNQNRTTGVVDEIKGSAKNFTISQTLLAKPGLIALGQLVRTSPSADPSAKPSYTYERNIGDNSFIDKLAALSTAKMTFGAAGELSVTSQDFGSYAGQIISTASAAATNNKSTMENSKLLLDGFSTRSDAVRGVNLDEELANTIIYQNAYSATARIITVVNSFFEALIQAAQ